MNKIKQDSLQLINEKNGGKSENPQNKLVSWRLT